MSAKVTLQVMFCIKAIIERGRGIQIVGSQVRFPEPINVEE
jgi:hypothetical protein